MINEIFIFGVKWVIKFNCSCSFIYEIQDKIDGLGSVKKFQGRINLKGMDYRNETRLK